jgi:hypothetical protein
MISEEQRKNPINVSNVSLQSQTFEIDVCTIWIPEVEIKFIKKISSGAFAKVFQGLYKGKYLTTPSLPRSTPPSLPRSTPPALPSKIP